jgi:hypothetical protein
VAVASTLPELLDDEAAARFAASGIPPVAGLRTGLECAAALRQPAGDPKRMREIGAATGRVREAAAGAAAASESRPERVREAAASGAAAASESGPERVREAAASGAAAASEGGAERAPLRPADGWLAEHEAKDLLRAASLPVVDGRLVEGEDDAVAALAELGGSLALKLSGAGLLHKSELGGLALDLRSAEDVRGAHRRLVGLGIEGTAVLAERMGPAGAELLVSARTDAVVPALVVGLGGIWTEAFDDVAIVPLPASPQRIETALRGLRGASLLTGGRGRPAVDLAALAALASAVGALVLDHRLQLIELNPVLAHPDGSLVIDALARR